jgi:hypothetical protein
MMKRRRRRDVKYCPESVNCVQIELQVSAQQQVWLLGQGLVTLYADRALCLKSFCLGLLYVVNAP